MSKPLVMTTPYLSRDINNEYTVTIRKKKYDTLQEISETHTPNEE